VRTSDVGELAFSDESSEVIDRVAGFRGGAAEGERLVSCCIGEVVELCEQLVTQHCAVDECMQAPQLVAARNPAFSESVERLRCRDHWGRRLALMLVLTEDHVTDCLTRFEDRGGLWCGEDAAELHQLRWLEPVDGAGNSAAKEIRTRCFVERLLISSHLVTQAVDGLVGM